MPINQEDGALILREDYKNQDSIRKGAVMLLNSY
jgi:hypothetical protein